MFSVYRLHFGKVQGGNGFHFTGPVACPTEIWELAPWVANLSENPIAAHDWLGQGRPAEGAKCSKSDVVLLGSSENECRVYVLDG